MIELKHISPDSLKPYKRNARVHSDRQIKQLVASIKEFGFTSPVVIDEKKNVIAGHGRLAAAKRLKLETVPCVEAKNLTTKQARSLRIADNKIAESAIWDFDLLKEEIKDLDLSAFGLDILPSIGEIADDVEENWKGMPEFNPPRDYFKRMVITWETEAEWLAFAEREGINPDRKKEGRFSYPLQKQDGNQDRIYIDE